VTLAAVLFKDAFEQELLEAIDQSGLEPDRWSTAGKNKKKDNPAGEDARWWRANGPGMVQNWMDWRKESGWKVLAIDGEPAIELDVEVDIGDGLPLKMFIDRVMIEPTNREPVIVDLKTGARTPESDLQLGVYRYGLMAKYGIRVDHGAYWMARKGALEMVPLQRYTPGLIATWFQRLQDAIGYGIFLPNPTFKCRACPVRNYCLAFGGAESELDPDFWRD